MSANHQLLLLVFPLMLIVSVTDIGLSTRAGIVDEERLSALNPKLADGLASWEQVYSVLTSPRCIN